MVKQQTAISQNWFKKSQVTIQKSILWFPPQQSCVTVDQKKSKQPERRWEISNQRNSKNNWSDQFFQSRDTINFLSARPSAAVQTLYKPTRPLHSRLTPSAAALPIAVPQRSSTCPAEEAKQSKKAPNTDQDILLLHSAAAWEDTVNAWTPPLCQGYSAILAPRKAKSGLPEVRLVWVQSNTLRRQKEIQMYHFLYG